MATAQQNVTTQYLYWLRYQNQILFSPSLYWNNEFDNRRFFDPDVENQFIIHSRLHYRKDRWDFASGLTASWSFTQYPENGYSHSTLELRPVADVSYEIPFKNWSLQQRARVDNRFFEANEAESIFEHSNYVLRLRYRIQAKIPLKSAENGNPLISLRISDEIMFNHKENTFDQNRVYVSLDFNVHKNLSLETQYIYIYQQRFGTDDFFNRHAVRFTVSQKINLVRVRS